VFLAVRRRSEWQLGLMIIALLLAGHVIHYWIVIAQSSVSGIERLFEIAAAPLLAAAIYRRAHWTVESPTAVSAAPPTVEVTRPIPEPLRPAAAPASLDPRA